MARVSEMLEVMSKADRLQKCGSLKRSHSSPRSPSCQGIEFDRVNVISPSGKLLARDLTFQVLLALASWHSYIHTFIHLYIHTFIHFSLSSPAHLFIST